MELSENVDQFQLLEGKIDGLIKLIKTLKEEKISFTEKLQLQDEKLDNLTEQIGNLKSDRDEATQKVVSLLEKIEQVYI